MREAAVLLLPVACRTPLPARACRRARLVEGREVARGRLDRAQDQADQGRCGPSGPRPHVGRLGLRDRVHRRRRCPRKPLPEACLCAPLASLNSSGKHAWIHPTMPGPGNPSVQILSRQPTISHRPRQFAKLGHTTRGGRARRYWLAITFDDIRISGSAQGFFRAPGSPAGLCLARPTAYNPVEIQATSTRARRSRSWLGPRAGRLTATDSRGSRVFGHTYVMPRVRGRSRPNEVTGRGRQWADGATSVLIT